MFQLLKYQENKSGAVDIMVQYDVPSDEGKQTTSTHLAPDPATAKAWIDRQMKLYAISKLSNFVQHKRILSKVSKMWQPHAYKFKSLETCLQLVAISKDMSTENLARDILRIEPDLKNILPFPDQLTYKSSQWNLEEIIYWANEILFQRH